MDIHPYRHKRTRTRSRWTRVCAVMISGIAVLCLLSVPQRTAQGDKLRLSLAEAQRTAAAQGPLLAVARAEVARAEAGHLGALAGLLPSVGIYETYTRTNDAVNVFGFRLKQERFTQADFALGSLNHPSALNNVNTRLVVRQPVFGGGDAIFRWRQARSGIRAAQGMQDRRGGEVAFAVAQAYYGRSWPGRSGRSSTRLLRPPSLTPPLPRPTTRRRWYPCPTPWPPACGSPT